MERLEICPCPNLECPNHGLCSNCASRHIKLGRVNYCGYLAVRADLKDAAAADPDSEAGKKAAFILERQEQAYARLREKHGITAEDQAAKEKAMKEFSAY